MRSRFATFRPLNHAPQTYATQHVLVLFFSFPRFHLSVSAPFRTQLYTRIVTKRGAACVLVRSARTAFSIHPILPGNEKRRRCVSSAFYSQRATLASENGRRASEEKVALLAKMGERRRSAAKLARRGELMRRTATAGAKGRRRSWAVVLGPR